MMKDIQAVTNRGVVLPGVLFASGKTDTVVINITGIHGNFYSNPFYYNIGNTLSENGIDFVYALTNDAYPEIQTINVKTGEEVVIGSATEDFNDTDDDIEAYLNFARKTGYKHIILSGHSLGVNKVIHYLSEHLNSDVEKFIFLSPANLEYMTRNVSEKQREFIRQAEKNGAGNKILPFYFMYWLRCTAHTAYQWLFEPTLRNVHVEKDGDFSQAEKITKSGAMFIGTLDNFTDGDPTEFLRNLNNHMRTKNQNQLIFIEGTEHTYRGHQQEIADDSSSNTPLPAPIVRSHNNSAFFRYANALPLLMIREINFMFPKLLTASREGFFTALLS